MDSEADISNDTFTDPATSPPSTSPKLEERCSICLGPPQNKCFTDGCSNHIFCFVCLCEWAKVKHECPMCKKKFSRVLHSEKCMEDNGKPVYEEYEVPPPRQRITSRRTRPDASALPPERQEIVRQIRRLQHEMNNLPPASNMHMERPLAFGGQERASQSLLNVVLQNIRTSTTRQQLDERLKKYRRLYRLSGNLNSSREEWIGSVPFRSIIYERGLVLQIPQNENRIRCCDPQFFEDNPALICRLVPWLNREIKVALRTEVNSRIELVTQIVVASVPRCPIRSQAFRAAVEPYLLENTTTFINEFYNFASSPHETMQDYDRHVHYRPPEAPVMTLDDSGSEPVPLNVFQRATPVTSTPVTPNNWFPMFDILGYNPNGTTEPGHVQGLNERMNRFDFMRERLERAKRRMSEMRNHFDSTNQANNHNPEPPWLTNAHATAGERARSRTPILVDLVDSRESSPLGNTPPYVPPDAIVDARILRQNLYGDGGDTSSPVILSSDEDMPGTSWMPARKRPRRRDPMINAFGTTPKIKSNTSNSQSPISSNPISLDSRQGENLMEQDLSRTSESSGDLEILCEMKPKHERTPPLVDLDDSLQITPEIAHNYSVQAKTEPGECDIDRCAVLSLSVDPSNLTSDNELNVPSKRRTKHKKRKKDKKHKRKWERDVSRESSPSNDAD